jgi:hypothetical protein
LPAALGSLSAIFFLAGLVLPWFGVPEVPPGAHAIVTRDAPATFAFKLIVLAALAGGVVLARRSRSPRVVAARVTAALFAALLLYPHVVMVWCPSTAARAAWFHAQHDSLIWSGGDLFTAAETKASDWKDRVYVADILAQTSVMHTPALSPRAVPFGDVRDLFEWFGYSNSFCLFTRAGWGLTLTGAMLLLIATFRARRPGEPAPTRALLATGASVLAGLMALALVPAGLCALEIERAREAAEFGRLVLALERLQLAARLLPMIGQNADVVDQVGLLEAHLGEQTLEVTLHEAKVLEARGQFEEAETLFAKVVGAPDPSDIVRREATRGLLRRAIRELNSGQASLATETLETVVAVEPCNVKANYALELAYLRSGRLEAVAPVAARIMAVYGSFGTITKLPVIGAVEETVAYAAYLSGDMLAASNALKKLSDPKRLRDGP